MHQRSSQSKRHQQHLVQLPLLPGKQGGCQQGKDHDQGHLATQSAKVHGLPLLHVLHIGLLAKKKIKGVAHQGVAERVDEERGQGRGQRQQKFFQLLRRPAPRHHQAPLPFQ